MTDHVSARLSFRQRMGEEPLPRQMAPREISPALKSALWAITQESIRSFGSSGPGYYVVVDPWRSLIKSFFIIHHHGDVDLFSNDMIWSQSFAKSYVFSDEYLRVFDFLDFIVGREDCPRPYRDAVESVLERNQAAYRVVQRMIVPVTSEENAQAVSKALIAVGAIPAKGPSTHLRAASRYLTSGDWGGAIRESIHAVESAAKLIEPTAETLGPALSKLETRGVINGAQKRAFSALYGYTSDTQGVRHALTFDSKPSVTEQDAIFMFGACAAFVSYLVADQPSL